MEKTASQGMSRAGLNSDPGPPRDRSGNVPSSFLGIWCLLLVLVPPAFQRVPVWLVCAAAVVSLALASWAAIQARSWGSRIAVLLMVIVNVPLNTLILVNAGRLPAVPL